MSELRIPVSTYRVQFSLSFRFVDGRDLVPYLNDLGITDLYSSPRFKARRGSPHAYDVADPSRINSELGTEEEFRELAAKLRNYEMGLLMDIVPNHMAASHENPWWLDLLENGVSSRFAHYFDVHWGRTRIKPAGENTIMIPILGDLYGRVLENQELAVKLDESGFFVRYYEHRLPLDPCTYGQIVERCLERMGRVLPASHPAREELTLLLAVIAQLPPASAAHPAERERRHRDANNVKKMLWRLYHKYPEVKENLDHTLWEFNGVKGEPGSFDLLDRLLGAQAYRLAHWRMAAEEIDYRRFFDISDLIAVRVEDPEVFDFRHRESFELVHRGIVTGLRVDHIDGLYDPWEYLVRVEEHAASPAQSAAETGPAFYTIAEKILAGDEDLPAGWRAHGTTGYDFLNYLNSLFVDPAGLAKLTGTYERFTGLDMSFADVRYTRKKMAMRELFAGEVATLGRQLGRLAAQDRYARDLSFAELVEALVEVTAFLPVYRTYARDFHLSARDHRILDESFAAAEHANARIDPEVFAFLRRVLTLDVPHYVQDRQEWLRFVMRWQQFTGPVMAKGCEDTACYVYNRLVSQNEVGSDPELADHPVDVEGFHRRNQARAARWPHTLNATSTHDTKRSEDVRARINVLSEIPCEWAGRLARWSEWNASKKQKVNGGAAPDANDEILLYQTLVGAWPFSAEELPALCDRIRNYVQKAAREAKRHTSWMRVNEAYENAFAAFAEAVLSDERFRADLAAFQAPVAAWGALNSLSQTLLKITAPGIPDFYQGAEIWDLSLVDPDNRRPVDFSMRGQMLDELRRRESADPAALVEDLVRDWTGGRIKLYVTAKALNFRRQHRALFREGGYLPVAAGGEKARHVCAFARRTDDAWAVVAAPRLVTGVASIEGGALRCNCWSDTILELPPGAPAEWRNVFTGERVAGELRLASLLARFPVALLDAS